MGIIKAKDYERMRQREKSGEKGVFFKEKETPHREEIDLDRLSVLTPRVRRRI